MLTPIKRSWELVGNVGFGRFINDLACHQEVKYNQDDS